MGIKGSAGRREAGWRAKDESGREWNKGRKRKDERQQDEKRKR